MKISKERWEKAQIAEYAELNETTDPGESAYEYAVRSTFELLGADLDNDFVDKVLVEIGTGFYPALLWAKNFKRGIAIDPLFDRWPKQYIDRCLNVGLEMISHPYEDLEIEEEVDETWFFNVLQHVIDPEEQLKKAMQTSKVVRIFEPIGWGNGIPLTINEAHPHIISKETITNVMGDFGFIYQPNQVDRFHQAECYYGTWKK